MIARCLSCRSYPQGQHSGAASATHIRYDAVLPLQLPDERVFFCQIGVDLFAIGVVVGERGVRRTATSA